MHPDRLHNLLQQADAVLGDALHADALPAAKSPSPASLASGIRRLARQRRQGTLLIGAGLVVVFSATAIWQAQNFTQLARQHASSPEGQPLDGHLPKALSPDAPVPAMQSPAEQMEATLATIDAEQRLVERMLAVERRQYAVAQAEALQAPLGLPAAEIEQLDRAASAIVLAAEHNQQRPQLLAAAREDYNLVLHLFPNTPWADLAQNRLMNINPHPTP